MPDSAGMSARTLHRVQMPEMLSPVPPVETVPVSAPGIRAHVAEALASVRAEGLEPGPEALGWLQAIADGLMSPAEARTRTLARYLG